MIMTMMQRSLCNVVTKLNKENFAGRYSLIESERGEELKQQPVVSNFCCWINIERHSLKNCVIEPTTKTCVEAKPKLNVDEDALIVGSTHILPNCVCSYVLKTPTTYPPTFSLFFNFACKVLQCLQNTSIVCQK